MVYEDTPTPTPGTDAKPLVRAPGKIYGKSGELLSEQEYEDRKEQDDAVMGYDQQIAALNKAAAAIHQETSEDKEKRERREKSQKTIAAITDGTRALANLFFTTQYAPNSYNSQDSQVRKVNERIEALKAERQADADRYHNLMLRIGDAQNAKAKTLRDMQAQQEAQKLAREKAQRDAELHKEDLIIKQEQGRKEGKLADKAGFDSISSYYEAENKPTELDLKNQEKEASIQQKKAAADSSNASAENQRSQAAKHRRETEEIGKDKEFMGLGKDGKEYPFKNPVAAIAFEMVQKTYDPHKWGHDAKKETEEEVTETGKKTTSSTTYPGWEFDPKKYQRGKGTTQKPPLN